MDVDRPNSVGMDKGWNFGVDPIPDVTHFSTFFNITT